MGNAGYGNHTEDKPYVDSERPDPGTGQLPSNATEPGEAPKATEGSRGDDEDASSDRLPPAGPHADPNLVNPEATPGTGALTPPGEHDDVDSTSS